MTSIKDKKIAVIGAGPGGLTLARLLQVNGANVKVYERDQDKNARPKGATLDLHEESGLLALKEAGLMDAFLSNYRPGADKLRIVNQHAEIIFDDHSKDKKYADRPEIDRGPLQNILLHSLSENTVVWDRHFVSLQPIKNGWKIEFKNGSCEYADLVIAADGANSKIRPYITPIKPFFSGVTALEGAVINSEVNCPAMHQLLKGGKVFAFGNSQSLIISSKGDGSLVFYTSFNSEENWITESGIDFNDKQQVINWFKNTYAEWGEYWIELFENATYFMPRPQYCMPLDQTWESLPNLTILGDAAHLMPPFAGEGVNMAMLDALELSKCLLDEKYPDLQTAIQTYEKQMRLRASEVAGITMVSTEALHSPDALKFMLAVIGE